MGKKSGFYINCENCNKEVYKTKSQYEKAKHHFCSNRCQKEYQHKQAFENRKCEICGCSFSISKKSSQRFCSVLCQNKWQTTLTGTNSNRFNSEIRYCEHCNKPIFVKQSKLHNGQHYFCSVSCRQIWFSEVWSQSPDWKELSRKRATKLLSKNCFKTNTAPQIVLNNLLDDMNIQYINEYQCTYYSIDNYLPEYQVMIEVMGDFWHAHPLKYNESNYREIQLKRIPKDKSKHTYIKNQYGIEILYLWESDLNNHIDLCRALIELYISDPTSMETYHSFNYHIENSQLTLNQNIIEHC